MPIDQRKDAAVTPTIVVGFINSPEGKAALAAAIEEAERRQAGIVLVNSSRGGDEDEEAFLSRTDELERLSDDLAAKGLNIEVLEIVRGNDPVDDLLDVAKERDAALIVIGLRRRSKVGKMLLGSNAQSILLAADCPVLAVKAPASES